MKHWTDWALCRDLDFDLFFPKKGDLAKTRWVKSHYCDRCPVRQPCLDAVMREETGRDTRSGIRGGTTPSERDALAAVA